MEIQIDLEKQIQYYQNKLNYEMDPSDLFEALERGESLVAVDTRRVKSYNKEHIPGALSLPHREINEQSTKDLDKTKTYICYCVGIGCNASTRGALKLAMLGFKVKELTGGLEWWKMDGYETHGTESFKGLEVKCAC
jgi:rhodanese-related sulfurtransferase